MRYKPPLMLLGSLILLCLGVTLVTAQAGEQIRIVKPFENQIVPIGSFSIEIALHGAAPNNANAWQLYMDDMLVSTSPVGATSTNYDFIESGPHQIKVVLLDRSGRPVSSNEIDVTAAPATPKGTAFNYAMWAPAMLIFIVSVLALIAIALRMRPRLAA